VLCCAVQVMAGLFALLTAAWLLLLLRPANKQQVFKIHWLMAALVFFKTLTLMTQVRGGGGVGVLLYGLASLTGWHMVLDRAYFSVQPMTKSKGTCRFERVWALLGSLASATLVSKKRPPITVL